MSAPAAPAGFLPERHPIEAYGNGGFRFAGMSHRGSLLVLPSGMRAWPVTTTAALTEADIAPVLSEAEGIALFILGTGPTFAPPPDKVAWALRDARVGVEFMATGPAARTYNVLLSEGRRVAAGLIAVD